MLTIVLIHPGDTEYDQQGRIQGNLDIPLCPQGREQIEQSTAQLGELDLKALYYSPTVSAEQTAEILAPVLDVKAKKLDKLANLDHGLWQGRLVSEVQKKQPKVYKQWQDQPESICPPEGEMVDSAKARAEDVLRRLVKKHKEGAIGLIAPEPLFSLFESMIGSQSLSEVWKSQRPGIWKAMPVEFNGKAQARAS